MDNQDGPKHFPVPAPMLYPRNKSFILTTIRRFLSLMFDYQVKYRLTPSRCQCILMNHGGYA